MPKKVSSLIKLLNFFGLIEARPGSEGVQVSSLLTLLDSVVRRLWCPGNYALSVLARFTMSVETPQANLVAGMKWLSGVYTKRFNIRHKLCGHLLAGRSKALILDGSGNPELTGSPLVNP